MFCWTDRSGFLHVAFVSLLHLLHVLILLTKSLLEFIDLLGHLGGEKKKVFRRERSEILASAQINLSFYLKCLTVVVHFGFEVINDLFLLLEVWVSFMELLSETITPKWSQVTSVWNPNRLMSDQRFITYKCSSSFFFNKDDFIKKEGKKKVIKMYIFWIASDHSQCEPWQSSCSIQIMGQLDRGWAVLTMAWFWQSWWMGAGAERQRGAGVRVNHHTKHWLSPTQHVSNTAVLKNQGLSTGNCFRKHRAQHQPTAGS